MRLWKPHDPGRSCLHCTIQHYVTNETDSQNAGALRQGDNGTRTTSASAPSPACSVIACKLRERIYAPHTLRERRLAPAGTGGGQLRAAQLAAEGHSRSSGSGDKAPGVCQLSRSQTNQTHDTGHLGMLGRAPSGFGIPAIGDTRLRPLCRRGLRLEIAPGSGCSPAVFLR
jgi:hypothetical protein